ncbi:MAG: hypothetical protein WBP45_13550 [Daejeonella sp.]
MPKKSITPHFTFSQDTLIQMAKSKASFIERDAAEFDKHNVTATRLTAFREKISTMENFPTDVELLGTQSVATETKDEVEVKLKNSIRGIMSRAVNKFGENSARYRQFGTKGLSHMTDLQLLKCAATVYRIGMAYLDQLASEGLTEPILTDLQNLRTEFNDADIVQSDAIANRDIATEDRIILANDIYDDLVKFCNTGKTIWANTDEARYNDYVIYDTASSK